MHRPRPESGVESQGRALGAISFLRVTQRAGEPCAVHREDRVPLRNALRLTGGSCARGELGPSGPLEGPERLVNVLLNGRSANGCLSVLGLFFSSSSDAIPQGGTPGPPPPRLLHAFSSPTGCTCRRRDPGVLVLNLEPLAVAGMFVKAPFSSQSQYSFIP